MDFIPESHFDLLGSGKVQKGDILYCLRGSLGKFGVVNRNGPGAIASSLVIVRPSKLLNVDYLTYYFRSSLASDMIDRFSGGAAQPNLSAKSLSQYKLPLPTLEEQQRLVALLDEVFKGLARARDNTKANRKDAELILSSFLDAQVSEMYQRFGSISVGEIAQVKGGKRLPKGQKTSSIPTPFPYITVRDLTEEGSVSTASLSYISSEIQKGISRYTISSRDVYVSIAGTIGKTGIVPDELDGANLTENAAKLVLKEGWDKRFIYWWTRSNDFSEQALEQTRVAAQPKLALQRLAAISLPKADRDAQKSFVQRIIPLTERTRKMVELYERDTKDLDDLRQSLLDKAFAGQLA